MVVIARANQSADSTQDRTGSNAGFVVAGVLGGIALVLVLVVVVVHYLRRALSPDALSGSAGSVSSRFTHRRVVSGPDAAMPLLVSLPSTFSNGLSRDAEVGVTGDCPHPSAKNSSTWKGKGKEVYTRLSNASQDSIVSSDGPPIDCVLPTNPAGNRQSPSPGRGSPPRPVSPVQSAPHARPIARSKYTDFSPYPLLETLIHGVYPPLQPSRADDSPTIGAPHHDPSAAMPTVPYPTPSPAPSVPAPVTAEHSLPEGDDAASASSNSCATWPTVLTTAFQNPISCSSTVESSSPTVTVTPSRYPSLAASVTTSAAAVSSSSQPGSPNAISNPDLAMAETLNQPLTKARTISAAARPLSVRSVFSCVPKPAGTAMPTIPESRPVSQVNAQQKAYIRASATSVSHYALYSAHARGRSASAALDFVKAVRPQTAPSAEHTIDGGLMPMRNADAPMLPRRAHTMPQTAYREPHALRPRSVTDPGHSPVVVRLPYGRSRSPSGKGLPHRGTEDPRPDDTTTNIENSRLDDAGSGSATPRMASGSRMATSGIEDSRPHDAGVGFVAPNPVRVKAAPRRLPPRPLPVPRVPIPEPPPVTQSGPVQSLPPSALPTNDELECPPGSDDEDSDVSESDGTLTPRLSLSLLPALQLPPFQFEFDDTPFILDDRSFHLPTNTDSSTMVS